MSWEQFLTTLESNIPTSDELQELFSSEMRTELRIDSHKVETFLKASEGIRTLVNKILPTSEAICDETNCSKHPLMIELVVRNIMKYLEKPDLLTCRLVCTLWNIEAGMYIRSKEKITLFSSHNQTLDAYISLTESNTFQTDKLPPYTHFSLQAQEPKAYFHPNEMKLFGQKFGQFIQHLDLFFPDTGILSPNQFLELLFLPNLISLHVINLPKRLTNTSLFPNQKNIGAPFSSIKKLRVDRPLEQCRIWSPKFLVDFFSILPNLNEYELWTWTACEDNLSKPYLTSLTPEQKSNLRTLKPGCIGEKLSFSLAFGELRLTKLFLPVLNRDMNTSALETLLASQKDTLRELQINCSAFQKSGMPEFPNMKNLRVLHVIIASFPEDTNSNFYVKSEPVNYSEHFPVIQCLRLELSIYMDENIMKYFFSGKSTSFTLEDIDLAFQGFREESFVPKVSNMFPKLRRFKLDGYGNKILYNICLWMPHLEELEVKMIFGFNVDDQLTGINKNVCNQLRNRNKAREGLGVNWEKVELSPSLCSLTRLRKLRLVQRHYGGECWPKSQCITDVTIYHALVFMNHLQSLTIEGIKLTQKSVNFLRQALEDCIIKIL